jgi:hydroxyacylglutathione hydrolase
MEIKVFTFNPFSTNCFVIADDGEAAVIDPSCKEPGEIDAVTRFVASGELTVRHLLLTHAHIDHIFGCRSLAEAFDLRVRLHPADLPLLRQANRQAELFGVSIDVVTDPQADLAEGDTIELGNIRLQVLHTPGHSPGSVAFVDRANHYVVAGDVLFRGSIGRTDLWEGSLPTLMQSIYQKIVPLGDAFTVHPGHGPSTSVGAELRQNPFLSEAFSEND